jgi:hypothetical protein
MIPRIPNMPKQSSRAVPERPGMLGVVCVLEEERGVFELGLGSFEVDLLIELVV